MIQERENWPHWVCYHCGRLLPRVGDVEPECAGCTSSRRHIWRARGVDSDVSYRNLPHLRRMFHLTEFVRIRWEIEPDQDETTAFSSWQLFALLPDRTVIAHQAGSIDTTPDLPRIIDPSSTGRELLESGGFLLLKFNLESGKCEDAILWRIIRSIRRLTRDEYAVFEPRIGGPSWLKTCLFEYSDGINISIPAFVDQTDMTRHTLFISYSHRDRVWLERFETHLAPVSRKRKITPWSDLRIGAGEQWEQAIELALTQAAIAALLISPDYLASEFIWSTEMPKILAHQEAGMRVLPLLARPCAWRCAPEIAVLQARPSDDRALSSGTEAEVDRDLAEFVYELDTLLQGSLDLQTSLRRNGR